VLEEVAPMFPEAHDSADDRTIEILERQLRDER
jgi:hypothetical protein